MSGATYRIDVRYAAEDTSLPWRASIYRESDGAYLGSLASETEDGIKSKAREAVYRVTNGPEPYSLLVDENGLDVPESHSVKA